MGDWTNALAALLLAAIVLTDVRFAVNDVLAMVDSWFAVVVFLVILGFASMEFPR